MNNLSNYHKKKKNQKQRMNKINKNKRASSVQPIHKSTKIQIQRSNTSPEKLKTKKNNNNKKKSPKTNNNNKKLNQTLSNNIINYNDYISYKKKYAAISGHLKRSNKKISTFKDDIKQKDIKIKELKEKIILLEIQLQFCDSTVYCIDNINKEINNRINQIQICIKNK